VIPELFLVGLIVGFAYYEWVGLSPGGVIPPAYFALFIHEPERILVTAALALIVYGAVRVLQRHTFLYGRRRLLAALLLGFVAKWCAEGVLAPNVSTPFEIHAVGYIIPGLVANDMVRQHVVPTVLSIGIATIIVGLVGMLMGIGWSGL
jgi:poly-gamma-glutamate biosynthesis protein PgsC/CapC